MTRLAVRRSLSLISSDHDASGEHRPTAKEIFAPEQHANALDPNTPIVVGARGAGKSFWAGVLEQDETRSVTAEAYPRLGLDRLVVKAGYTGFAGQGLVTSKIIDSRIPEGEEAQRAADLWQAIIIRAGDGAIGNMNANDTIKQYMDRYRDPEDATQKLGEIDERLRKNGLTLLVTFDALDTLSRDWQRSTQLVDALMETVWSLRSRKSIRAKIFIRPEQLNDDALKFVELPKLRSNRVELAWNQLDLYGLLFWRLSEVEDVEAKGFFASMCDELGAAIPKDRARRRTAWSLLTHRAIQKDMMVKVAGPYMGRGYKKGGTYDWPYKHLGDAAGKVTPRSFLKLFAEAAKFGQAPADQVISAEGIRHGLREASKVRVDQLVVEYKWVSRALAPLAGLTVPCSPSVIYEKWEKSKTIQTIMKASQDNSSGFLPPFPARRLGDKNELLAGAMARIGVIAFRPDGRFDMPDLFRVAASMLKKGGTTPNRSN